MKKLLIVFLLFFCTACSGIKNTDQASTKKDDRPSWPVIPVASDATIIRAVQNISAQFIEGNVLERNESFQGIIEIQPGSLHLILLGSGGQRLATITQNQEQLLAKTHIKLPIKLPLAEILETIQLIYFPAMQLTHYLQQQQITDWQIKEQHYQRQIFFQKNLYAEIVYNNVNPWNGKTVYHNNKYNYTITINSSLLP